MNETKFGGGEGMDGHLNPVETGSTETNEASPALAQFIRKEGLPMGTFRDFNLNPQGNAMTVADGNPDSKFVYMAIDADRGGVYGIMQEDLDNMSEELKNELQSIRKEPRFT